VKRLLALVAKEAIDGLHFWNPARSGFIGGIITGIALFGAVILFTKLF
jgi:hypothetical protein